MPLPKSEITAGAFYADRHDRARKILACTGGGVPFFFKQWSGRTPKAGGRLLDGRTHDEFPESTAGGGQ